MTQKERGGFHKLTYLTCLEKAIPRRGYSVQKNSENIGVVSSGTLSPCLNRGIAMAYVHPDFRKIDNILDIIIRNTSVKARVIKMPFVKKDWALHN